MSGPVLSIRGLSVAFGDRVVLSDVSFDLRPGETLAVIGRSGSGKSTLLQAIAGLLPPTARTSATRFQIQRKGASSLDLREAAEREFARVRGHVIGAVFQEPEASLDPLFRIGHQVVEVLRSGGLSRAAARRKSLELLAQAGLRPPERYARAYPSELSGGENQRVNIAAAIALDPPILLADEPTSALDVLIEAEVLALLRSLTRTRSIATLLVTHDFEVVAAAADRVAVITGGRIVEDGPVRQILDAPREAATRELLAARIEAGAP